MFRKWEKNTEVLNFFRANHDLQIHVLYKIEKRFGYKLEKMNMTPWDMIKKVEEKLEIGAHSEIKGRYYGAKYQFNPEDTDTVKFQKITNFFSDCISSMIWNIKKTMSNNLHLVMTDQKDVTPSTNKDLVVEEINVDGKTIKVIKSYDACAIETLDAVYFTVCFIKVGEEINVFFVCERPVFSKTWKFKRPYTSLTEAKEAVSTLLDKVNKRLKKKTIVPEFSGGEYLDGEASDVSWNDDEDFDANWTLDQQSVKNWFARDEVLATYEPDPAFGDYEHRKRQDCLEAFLYFLDDLVAKRGGMPLKQFAYLKALVAGLKDYMKEKFVDADLDGLISRDIFDSIDVSELKEDFKTIKRNAVEEVGITENTERAALKVFMTIKDSLRSL